MNKQAFPHREYLIAASAFAFGGYAMTAGIISGDLTELHRLVDHYLYALRILVLALVGYAIVSNTDEDDDP
jgi:hypothetical protein